MVQVPAPDSNGLCACIGWLYCLDSRWPEPPIHAFPANSGSGPVGVVPVKEHLKVGVAALKHPDDHGRKNILGPCGVAHMDLEAAKPLRCALVYRILTASIDRIGVLLAELVVDDAAKAR